MNRNDYKHTKYATISEIKCGIYIDFESFKDKEPCLVGILIDQTLDQIVLDEKLKMVADETGHSILPLDEVLDKLIQKAKYENRRIFAFTRHEYEVVRDYSDYGEVFLPLYADVHKIAKRWRSLCHPELVLSDKTLHSFAKMIGEPYPNRLGKNMATGWLRNVYEQIDKKDTYQGISPSGKKDWKKFLAYNKKDVEVMYSLVDKAVRELQSRSS